MDTHARVSVTDTLGRHTGTVLMRRENGMCSVKWDTGITELIHENELVLEDACAESNSKSPSWRDRIASLWDSRSGK